MKTFENGRTLSWKYMLHAWQTYAICPFANAVCLATTEPKPATAISLSDLSTDLVVDGTANITVTITPNDATTDISFYSEDETVFTVTKNSNTSATLTGVDVGESVLKVLSDNGLSKTKTIEVGTSAPTTEPVTEAPTTPA